MYIHPSARLVYLAHPRTASVATSTALKKAGFHKLDPPSDHHSRLHDGWSRIASSDTPRRDWTVFTTVRNHWDAAVSWVFRKYSTRGGEPPEWNVDAFRFALGDTNRWVDGTRLWWLHRDDADVLLRYESLDRDLGALLSQHGLDVPPIPRHNVSEHRQGRHYKEFYDSFTRDYVYYRFRREIAELNYVF